MGISGSENGGAVTVYHISGHIFWGYPCIGLKNKPRDPQPLTSSNRRMRPGPQGTNGLCIRRLTGTPGMGLRRLGWEKLNIYPLVN